MLVNGNANKPQKRTLTQHALAAYVEENFPAEAVRSGYDGRALWAKRQRDTRRWRVVKNCTRRFASLGMREQRLYQYKAEKKWPLWFERPDSAVDREHLKPDPDQTVKYELDHFSRNKKGNPNRNQWLTKQRQSLKDMPETSRASLDQQRDMILRSRAKLKPYAPRAPPVPGKASPTGRVLWLDERKIGEWECDMILYAREHCCVALYRMKDKEDKTTDTMVIKRERRDPVEAVSPKRQALSSEEYVVHRLISAACPRYTVRYIDGNVRRDKNPERELLVKTIYMDWCPHGNLDELIDHYYENGHMIPEPFVWYCFRVVAENALVCWNGHAGRGKKASWEHIVNCDMKPSNVFLDAPDPEEPMAWARRYPQPKVGDFGMAFITHGGLDDKHHRTQWRRRKNPVDFRAFGSPGHTPPESLPREHRYLKGFLFDEHRVAHIARRLHKELEGEDGYIDSRSMVWQIGMMMWCMLSNNSYGSTNREQSQMLVDFSATDGSRDLPARETRHGAPLRPAYSGRLVELVYQCLAFLPRHRIGLEELWEQVVEGCDNVAAVFDGHQTADPPDGPNTVSYVPDKYPLGKVVQRPPGVVDEQSQQS